MCVISNFANYGNYTYYDKIYMKSQHAWDSLKDSLQGWLIVVLL